MKRTAERSVRFIQRNFTSSIFFTQLSVLAYEVYNCFYRLQLLQEELILPDWIQTVQWLSEDHIADDDDGDGDALPGHLAAALSHNVVILLDTKMGNVLEEIHCEDKCILYPLFMANAVHIGRLKGPSSL